MLPAHLRQSTAVTLLNAYVPRPNPVAARSKTGKASRPLGLRVRILPGAWVSVSCECCVLSGRGLCDGLITRPLESYRV